MKTINLILSCLICIFLNSCKTISSKNPFNKFQITNNSLVLNAKKWEGKHYRYKSYRQCGNWIATVAKASGKQTPKNPARARNWLNVGTPVQWSMKRPGDILVFSRGRGGHVIINLDGEYGIHRSTYKKPVQKVKLSRYKNRLLGVRRL